MFFEDHPLTPEERAFLNKYLFGDKSAEINSNSPPRVMLPNPAIRKIITDVTDRTMVFGSCQSYNDDRMISKRNTLSPLEEEYGCRKPGSF